MFKINMSHHVKTALAIKKNKITDYGKSGEFAPKGLKAKIYSFLPVANGKYVLIQSVEIEWIPTVAHLLGNALMSIKLRDSRCSQSKATQSDLLFLKKRADNTWTLRLETEIYIPTSELVKGLPLLFDIDLSTANVKADREIGKLIFRVNISTARTADKSSIGPAFFNYQNKETVESDLLLWKGMPSSSIADNNDTSPSLVSKYLKGDITMEELGNQMFNKILASSAT
ncbi:TPA_asm: P3 [Coptis gammacytorhabdovirus 1]|nr:TPA_asm: P3 [Coptis gammacytorhabdovirus 1]